MIEKTDTWRTDACGCRLQLSIHHPEEFHQRQTLMNMWVIREECATHAEEFAAINEYLEKVKRGEAEFEEEEVCEECGYLCTSSKECVEFQGESE